MIETRTHPAPEHAQRSPAAPRIVVAGGGVAGLEALLALRAHLGEAASIVVISPDREFVLRALGVAEPFGRSEAPRWSLAELVAAAGASFSQGAISEVDSAQQSVNTDTGHTFEYDHLLLTLGTQPREALPGALTYRGPRDNPAISELLEEIRARPLDSVAFAVPVSVKWALPLYELALQTAAYVHEHGLVTKVSFVTHETRPLGSFGRIASESVQKLLDERGIEYRGNSAPASVHGNELALMNGVRVVADRVVALPTAEVPPIPGVPQGPGGFIGTDPYMRVESLEGVYAAGDATWFPIKQGGISTQQADTAARTIANRIDAEIELEPFNPILRGTLLTGGAPRYLRGEITRPEASESSSAPLWAPSGKIAGRYLAPFLSARAMPPNQPAWPLEDLGDAADLERTVADHEELVELALTSARADARWGDYRAALRWLEIVEALEVTLTPEQLDLRAEWAEADRRRRGRG